MKRILILAVSLILIIPFSQAQKYGNDGEQVLIAKKWTVVGVKGKNHKLALGEELKFEIERTFSYKKNDYTIIKGTWKLTGTSLLLVVETYEGDKNLRLPKSFKIKKLSRSQLVLKFNDGETKGTVTLE